MTDKNSSGLDPQTPDAADAAQSDEKLVAERRRRHHVTHHAPAPLLLIRLLHFVIVIMHLDNGRGVVDRRSRSDTKDSGTGEIGIEPRFRRHE